MAGLPTMKDSRRIVVKIGSQLVVSAVGIRRGWLASIASDIVGLRQQGCEVVLVSSGAIAVGCRIFGDRSSLTLEEQQAAAAVGQGLLFEAWRQAFVRQKQVVAQILVTLEDTERRRRYLNIRETLSTLLRRSVVPIVNENDTVATDEIRFGDNDRLAARIAQTVQADTLVLLSHVDGLYTADPTHSSDASHIPLIKQITPQIAAMAADTKSRSGSGGMITKLEAARITTESGCHMVICDGQELHPLRRLQGGDGLSSWFLAKPYSRKAHKQWIAGALQIGGDMVLDAGAVHAVRLGRSLLPSGVLRVKGNFERGDVVYLRDENGGIIARGLSGWSADDATRICQVKGSEIVGILGYRGRSVMVHCDDLVLEDVPV